MYNKIHYIVPLRDDFSFTNDNSQNILYENNFVKELSAMLSPPPRGGVRGDLYFKVLSVPVMLTLSAKRPTRLSMLTRSCSMVSRLRKVTQLSLRVSWSIVIQ